MKPHSSYTKRCVGLILDANGNEERIKSILEGYGAHCSFMGTPKPASERDCIINRLNDIKMAEADFTTDRWKRLKFGAGLVRTTDYKELNDIEIVMFFELVLKIYHGDI